MIPMTKIPSDVNLSSFFSKYKNVYIYGAGKYGKVCADLFSACNISFYGYIVSKKDKELIDGYSVYSYDEICRELASNDCLVMAMRKEYQLEVLSNTEKNFDGQLVDITSHILFKRAINRDFVVRIEGLGQKYPPSKYVNNDFSNILVIRLDRIGDMIWTSAFYRELRGNFPDAHITAVCTTSNLHLLNNCPYVDERIGYDYSYDEELGKLSDREVLKRAREFAEERLRGRKYDVVFLPRGIMPRNTLANIYLAIFSSASVRIAGYYATNDKVEEWYRDIMNKIFSVVAEHKYPLHEVEKALNVIKSIGCKIESEHTEVWYKNTQVIADMNTEQVCTLRSKFDYLIAIGLTSQSAARTWDPYYYKELFARLGGTFSVCFLLLGGLDAKKEATIAFDDRYCLDFTGKTNYNDVMQLISLCDIYVGSNTGLEHIAAALKKPVIEISASFPWGDDNMGLSPKNCGAWRTKYTVLCPEVPKDEVCAKAGYCVNEKPHCINGVSVDSVQNMLIGFMKYGNFSCSL